MICSLVISLFFFLFSFFPFRASHRAWHHHCLTSPSRCRAAFHAVAGVPMTPRWLAVSRCKAFFGSSLFFFLPFFHFLFSLAVVRTATPHRHLCAAGTSRRRAPAALPPPHAASLLQPAPLLGEEDRFLVVFEGDDRMGRVDPHRPNRLNPSPFE